MPFVDPSLRALNLDSSDKRAISVVYGQDTPELFDNLTKSLILLGEWIQLMSAAVEILTPHNSGYKQKMLMVRYYPERIKKRQVPLYLPSRIDQLQMDPEGSAQYNAWRFSNQTSIRTLLANSHVTGFDEFFGGIFYLIGTIQNLMQALQEAKMQGSAIDNVNLQAVVDQAQQRMDRNVSKIRIAAAFYQCVERVTASAGGVVYPEGVSPNPVDVESIALQITVQKLQTSFVEQAMQYFAGARLALPSNGPTPAFIYVVDRIPYGLSDLEAVRGRFDRRARKYWSPFSWSHGRRGIEVVNPDELFEAPYLRQMRDRRALNSFKAELAARALFETVHTIYLQDYVDRRVYHDETIHLGPDHQNAQQFTLRYDGSGPGLPVEHNLIDVLRWNGKTRGVEGRFQFEQQAGLGKTTLGLFPSKYSDEAITMYNTMQQTARTHQNSGLAGRHTALLREDPTAWMQWLDEDLHPSNPEGTLQNAAGQYEETFQPNTAVQDDQDNPDDQEGAVDQPAAAAAMDM